MDTSVYEEADLGNNMSKEKEQLDRIERMLKFLICRMPFVTFNDVQIEDAPDISDILDDVEKK